MCRGEVGHTAMRATPSAAADPQRQSVEAAPLGAAEHGRAHNLDGVPVGIDPGALALAASPTPGSSVVTIGQKLAAQRSGLAMPTQRTRPLFRGGALGDAQRGQLQLRIAALEAENVALRERLRGPGCRDIVVGMAPAGKADQAAGCCDPDRALLDGGGWCWWLLCDAFHRGKWLLLLLLVQSNSSWIVQAFVRRCISMRCRVRVKIMGLIMRRN
eukprot:COSAG01_NODE_470_length_16575_cov_5.572408_16_plen_215_part_00